MTAAILYTKPSITDLEVRYAADAAANGWGARCYEYIHRFEASFQDHLGVPHAIATSSCTGAMHMGLAGLGIGAGDEVILADINWIATAAPITYLGATPVLVDILPDSWCIDPALAEEAITPATKAIVATHLYGNLCDMDALLEIGARHGIPIVEDAAEALGSVWNGKRAGSMGAFGTFSFHGTKTVTTGEGGMFVTNDDGLHERVLTLSNHGRSPQQKKQFWADMVGFKYKLSNIQAAIGCAQMERIDELIAGKRAVFEAYRTGLCDLRLSMNPEPPGTVNGFWMPTIVAEDGAGLHRDELISALQASSIDARVFFWPLSMLGLPALTAARTPIAHSTSSRGLNLPSYHDLQPGDLNRVIDAVRDAWGGNERE